LCLTNLFVAIARDTETCITRNYNEQFRVLLKLLTTFLSTAGPYVSDFNATDYAAFILAPTTEMYVHESTNNTGRLCKAKAAGHEAERFAHLSIFITNPEELVAAHHINNMVQQQHGEVTIYKILQAISPDDHSVTQGLPN
jgi:hypothetical protein